MQTESTRAPGIFARLRGRLRGDRYMVDAYRPAPVAVRPAPAPVAGPPEPPVARER